MKLTMRRGERLFVNGAVLRFRARTSLEFLNDDELVEVTPAAIRIRKLHLLESDRKRHERKAKAD